MQANQVNELLSTAKLCQILQRSPEEIRRAAEAAGVNPELVLNDIRYFPAESMQVIRDSLKPISEPLC